MRVVCAFSVVKKSSQRWTPPRGENAHNCPHANHLLWRVSTQAMVVEEEVAVSSVIEPTCYLVPAVKTLSDVTVSQFTLFF